MGFLVTEYAFFLSRRRIEEGRVRKRILEALGLRRKGVENGGVVRSGSSTG